MLDWLTGSSAAPPPAAQRAQAEAAQQRARQAQRDAQATLSPAPTAATGTLPCGLPITTRPCDLKDLQVKERRNARGGVARTERDSEAEERSLPAEFTIVTRGQADRNPYATGTIVEVTGGIAADHVKTSIDLVIGEDYQFCALNTHPHLIITSEGDEPLTLRGVKRHSMQVYRKPRGTDASDYRSFVDMWPVRVGFRDYQISAHVCGARQGGPAVGSQNTVVRVYPNEFWELEVNAPPMFGASTERRAGAGWSSEEQFNRPGTNITSAPHAPAGTASSRCTAELKRNGNVVMALAGIMDAINALKDIERVIEEAFQALRNLRPRVGVDFQFAVEVFTGTLKASWGYKEWTDRRVFYLYTLDVQLTLLKLKVVLSFGVDLTVRRYGFVANVEGKVEGSVSVGAQIERKKPEDPQWTLTRFKGDVPASLTARGVAIEDRILTLRGQVESGLEAEGNVAVDAQGLGVKVDKIEFKGVLLKGRATVISLFDVDVEYRAVQKRVIARDLRVPS